MHFVHACACLWVCSRRPTCPCLLNGESRSTEYICWRQRMQLWCGRGCIFFFFFTFFSVFIMQNETRSRTRAWKNTSKKWLTRCCPSYNAPKLTLIKWCWYCDLPKASVHVSREYWLQWCSFFFGLRPSGRGQIMASVWLSKKKRSRGKKAGEHGEGSPR